ncbi:MAG: metal-sulfur cluster assembly factor [Halodesulfurarchaeum sp.]
MGLREDVRDALSEVYDPEIPVNIVDLGLVYSIEAEKETGSVYIEMTLTSMGCPIADSIKRNVGVAAQGVEDVEEVTVELVWEPPWSPEKATETGKAQLESMGIRVPNYNTDAEEDPAGPETPF